MHKNSVFKKPPWQPCVSPRGNFPPRSLIIYIFWLFSYITSYLLGADAASLGCEHPDPRLTTGRATAPAATPFLVMLGVQPGEHFPEEAGKSRVESTMGWEHVCACCLTSPRAPHWLPQGQLTLAPVAVTYWGPGSGHCSSCSPQAFAFLLQQLPSH